MRIFSKGFNFGQDGPGNRLVYHLSGCNMHCIWCSNPDGMDKKAGKEVPVNEIFEEIKSSRPMFFSGGGVTFTGGEATLQEKELVALLKQLKNQGIHTALETNATSIKLPEIAQYVNFLIMDFKHFDSEILKEFTGAGNEIIKENFEHFCKTKRQLLVRIPLINGVNADVPEGFSEYFKRFDTENVSFEFLSYHEYGREKWKTPYKVQNGFITKEQLENFKREFREKGLKITTT